MRSAVKRRRSSRFDIFFQRRQLQPLVAWIRRELALAVTPGLAFLMLTDQLSFQETYRPRNNMGYK